LRANAHRREGGQRVEKFAFGSARLRDFLVRSLLLSSSTIGEMQSYEDFHLNAYLWVLFDLLLRLHTIALSAQFAANASVTQPARRWIP
jgi:hypothetical protein